MHSRTRFKDQTTESQSQNTHRAVTASAKAKPEPLAQSDGFTPALSAQFREKIRPVLNSIDRLRSHGLQNELRLPSVAVVGDQSVGKSSVLEAISGVCLPRGSGIVTRCPLQLSMRSRSDGQWRGHISYKDSSDKRVELDISDKSLVDKFVHEAQNAITGTKTGVSKQQIDLTIESSDVSDLTLIDLPGIARYSETHADISKTTKDLIRFYISQEQVIILVVVPCHVDIETVEAIALAKEVDPFGQRTIGVMTCPDLTNPGSENDVIATLCNMGSVRLKKGFVMVKCRSPNELKTNISLSDMSRVESEFFANHEHFSRISKDLVGTKTLADRLTDELFKAVASGMDALETNLKSKLKEFESELNDLGDSQCDSEDKKRFYLMRKLQQFLSRVSAVTACSDSNGAMVGGASHLYSDCVSHCSHFGRIVDVIKPAWIRSFHGEIPSAVEKQVRELRGRELPTFTFVFSIVHSIVRDEYLPQVKQHSLQLLETVRMLVTKALYAVCTDLFRAFPHLLADVRRTVAMVTDAKEAECRADLEKLMCQEGRVFTQDSVFNEEHSRSAATRQKEVSESTRSKIMPAETAFSSSFARFGTPPIATAAAALAVGNSQPRSDPPPEQSNAEKVRIGAHAYLSVASKRIADTVPMSILSHMLDGVAAALELEMTRLFAEGTGVLQLLEESPDRKRRRCHLTEAVEQMKASHTEMLKVKRSRLDD